MDEAHGLEVAAAVADQLIDDGVCCGACWKDDCVLGCVGCSGRLYCVDDGARVLNRARSGVTVRKPGWPLPMAGCVIVVVVVEGLVGFCVDHENEGVFGVLDELLIVVVDGDMTGGVLSQLGKPLLPLDDADMLPLPLTSASKSSSFPPVPLSKVVPVTPPNARKSSLGRAVPALVVPDSSCSFFVCSSSTFLDSVLMSSMNV